MRYPCTVSSLQIQEDVELAPFTTMGVGGRARFFSHVRTESTLEEAVRFAAGNRLPLAILGGGSNLLIHDEGFPGIVLYLDIQDELRQTMVGKTTEFAVSAGTAWDDFVLTACQQGLTGVECLAGIPGLTGGTPVQNVGAYGQEVAQTITTVRAFDRLSGSFTSLSREDCRFSYRSSRFNTTDRNRYLITYVTFGLHRGPTTELTYAELQRAFRDKAPTPLEVYATVRKIRQGKGMLLSQDDPDSRSAGSFFKNPIVPLFLLEGISEQRGLEVSQIPHWPSSDPQHPKSVKLSAAWLVEHAGFGKGFISGRAGISSRHSLALINRGGSTFYDVAALRDRIQEAVSKLFGTWLEQEPVELGPDTVDSFNGKS